MIPWPTCWPALHRLTIPAQNLDLQLLAEFFDMVDWFGVLELLGNSTRPNRQFRCFMSSFWFPIPQLHHYLQPYLKPSRQHGLVAHFAQLCRSQEQVTLLMPELDLIQDCSSGFCFSIWMHLWLCLASSSLVGSPVGLLLNMLLWLRLHHGTYANSFWFGPPFGWHREVVSWFYSPLSSVLRLVLSHRAQCSPKRVRGLHLELQQILFFLRRQLSHFDVICSFRWLPSFFDFLRFGCCFSQRFIYAFICSAWDWDFHLHLVDLEPSNWRRISSAPWTRRILGPVALWVGWFQVAQATLRLNAQRRQVYLFPYYAPGWRPISLAWSGRLLPTHQYWCWYWYSALLQRASMEKMAAGCCSSLSISDKMHSADSCSAPTRRAARWIAHCIALVDPAMDPPIICLNLHQLRAPSSYWSSHWVSALLFSFARPLTLNSTSLLSLLALH